jgi:guanylate kinase
MYYKQQNYKNQVTIISAPSGTGKTSILNQILYHNDKSYLSISMTSRMPRKEEINGKSYYFLSDFFFKKTKRIFLEYAFIFHNHYATPKKNIVRSISHRLNIFLDIDFQGKQNIEKKNILTKSVFFIPPSLKKTQERLNARNKDSHIVIEKRIKKTNQEMRHWIKYDKVIVNNNLEKTIKILESFIEIKNLN